MFVRDALRRELPLGTMHEGPETHGAYRDIPEAMRHRPALAFVRNPWDWYVSAYHFAMQPSSEPPGDPLDARMVAAIFGDYENSFAEMVRNACGITPLPLSDSDLDEMREHGSSIVQLMLQGYDLYSACLFGLVGTELSDRGLTVGRQESLVDDLEEFFVEQEVVIADGAFARMRQATPINGSVHRHYREYYDNQLRDQVGESCSQILLNFDYRF